MNRYQRLATGTRVPRIPTSSDKILHVDGLPKEWPACPEGCLAVAKYVLRAALEQNCVYIQILRGPQHKHTFDVGTVLQHVVREVGFIPQPGLAYVPQHLATVGHLSGGAELNLRPVQVAVPAALTSPPLCLSGEGGKERHGE